MYANKMSVVLLTFNHNVSGMDTGGSLGYLPSSLDELVSPVFQ